VVLDTTPFYAESGGQVGDQGIISANGGAFKSSDTLKIQAEVFGHHGVLAQGSLKVGDKVERARSMKESARAPSATTRPRT
jgi:alanyl-tRNA synthetase